jgi:glycosyltransferase involved in cell wall biosynthesis
VPEPRTILFATGHLRVGGAERVVVELANRLDRARWRPHVLCLAGAGPLSRDLRDVPLHLLEKRPGLDPRLRGRIRAVLREVRPALVNAHLWTANTWMRLAVPRGGPPVVATEHNRDSWKRAHHRMIDRRLAGGTRAVVAVSKDVRDFYVEAVGLPPDRVTVIPNGVETAPLAGGEGWRVRAEFGVPDDAPLLGCICRLEPQKNVPRLLRTFARVRETLPEARLLLVGVGTDYHRAARAAHDARLGAALHFAGARSDIPDILAALDLFLLASDREGHPLTALEAQAAGVPVVLPDVGGCREAIAANGSRAGGRLVPPDAEALAQAALDLLGDPGALRDAGAFAQAFAREHFDVARMVGRYDGLFTRLLGGGGAEGGGS